jgi:hypothetical protein
MDLAQGNEGRFSPTEGLEHAPTVLLDGRALVLRATEVQARERTLAHAAVTCGEAMHDAGDIREDRRC